MKPLKENPYLTQGPLGGYWCKYLQWYVYDAAFKNTETFKKIYK